jgi:Putative metallopeptidase
MIRNKTAWLTACFVCALAVAPADAQRSVDVQTRRVQVAYIPPKDPAHQPIHDLLRERRTLEKVQEFFSPFRLPRSLLLKLEGCDGVANAWYDGEAVTICYEYLDEFRRNAPKETTSAGITPQDALVGPFLDVVLHEMAHALFDILQIPVFGREEDAADQFSAYVLLQFGRDDARRLIGGAAYVYKGDMQAGSVTLELKAFSNEHGTPAQRFFNLMCIAYGADAELFADVVEKGYLPPERAEMCEGEYDQVAHAFEKLIEPHLDWAMARKIQPKKWLRELTARPARIGKGLAPR